MVRTFKNTGSTSKQYVEFQCFLLLITAAIIFCLGILMVFNTSSAEAIDARMQDTVHVALVRQLLYAFIGAIFSALVWFIGYQSLIHFSPYLLVILSIFLILVFVPHIGVEVNGAHRWVRLGSYTFQPSEFLKLLLPIFYICKLEEIRKNFKSFLKFFSIMGIPLCLVLVEPANGTTAIIGITLISLLFLTRVAWKYWMLPMLVVGIIGGICALNMPHVQKRLQAYKNPELDIQGKGHQPYQAKIAAGSGGMLGKGLGKSMQKLHYLPEAQNDYIAAIYAEEFGFIGIFFLIVLYMSMTYLGFSIAIYAKDLWGMYLASALTFLIAIQAFLNLAVVSGLLPSTGLNLPFFSQGGTSLIANMIGLTVLFNIGWSAKGRHYNL